VVAIAALLVALLLAPAKGHAYDYDTHYLWTYYLALNAGFTDRQAYQIASGAQAIDVDRDVNPIFLGSLEAYRVYSPSLGSLLQRYFDPANDPRDRYRATQELWEYDPGINLTAVLGPESRFGNPAMGRVWRYYHCFVDRTLQDRFELALRGELPWSFDDLVGLATQVDGRVGEARVQRRQGLWAQAVADGNPGPYLHFSQDCYSHGEFTDLRGHAVYGHAPDWWSVHEMRAWHMTKETLAALGDFRSQYLGEPAVSPDMARIRAVFRRMVEINPSEVLGIYEGGDNWIDEAHSTPLGEYQNFWGPVFATVFNDARVDFALPDNDRAFLVISQAVEEDRAAGRLHHEFPEVDWEAPPKNCIPYDYDSNAQVHMDMEEFVGGTSFLRARSRSGDAVGWVDAYRVEKPEVEILDDTEQYPRVHIRPDRTSRGLYTVDVALTYEVSKVGAFGSGLPVYEECKWSDFFEVWNPPSKGRGNGTWQIKSQVFRTYEQLKPGISWTCTLHAYGFEPKEVTVDVRWSGPPPEEEEREPGASEDLVRLWEALLATRDRALGTKAQIDSVCTSVAATCEAVGTEIREFDRSLGPMEREVNALERVADILPTARETIDGDARNAYQAAERAAESRSRVGESALETCETAERIRSTEDIPELLRLMERASEAHKAAEGWRDTTLDEVAAARTAAEHAAGLRDQVFGFETELAQVEDYLDRALPALVLAQGQVESAAPVLEGASRQVAVFAALGEEASGILGEGEGMLESAPGKENKRVVRRMRGLHRQVSAMVRNGGVCLEREKGKLDLLAPKVASLEESTGALSPRVERLTSISLDPDTLYFIEASTSEAEASFAAADLFPDSVREMVDQSAICLGVGQDVGEERTSPEAQVAAYDCSMFSRAEARWDRRKRQPACFCENDSLMWNARGTGCEPIPEPEGPDPEGPDPDDPEGPRCQYQATVIQQFRANPDPFYQQMAQQTADLAVGMGCDPALIARANGASAGGAGSTTSGAASGAYKVCEWSQGGTGTFGSGDGDGTYHCGCFMHYPDGTARWVDPEGDWECGPLP
jgi:hypothetical protein